jgi:hypothetical protein
MDRQICATVLKSGFELFHKKALATNLREGFIQDLVSPGSHTQNLDIAVWIERFEAISEVFCLPHGKATFAGGDNKALWGSQGGGI